MKKKKKWETGDQILSQGSNRQVPRGKIKRKIDGDSNRCSSNSSFRGIFFSLLQVMCSPKKNEVFMGSHKYENWIVDGELSFSCLSLFQILHTPKMSPSPFLRIIPIHALFSFFITNINKLSFTQNKPHSPTSFILQLVTLKVKFKNIF